ncbi:Uncharacterized protein SVXHr_0225 [Halorhabdus sp. SVX81]|nr:Uncharacterized protein SVXHr_0225 [Halorhabdus sp. SVX81]
MCEQPQVDARHLANHLAFTALLGDDDHERWLAEHAPGWDQEDDEGLADRVRKHAEEVDVPGADTVEHDHGTGDPEIHEHAADVERTDSVDRPGDLAGGTESIIDEHDPGVTFDDIGGGPTAGADPTLDADAMAVLREAYEMTRTRREQATGVEDDGESHSDDSDDHRATGERTGAEPADTDAGETE